MMIGPPDDPSITKDGAEPDKVTRLPVRFKEPPDPDRVLLGPYEVPAGRKCDHKYVQYIVDPSESEVTCGKCGTKLNPMWVLNEIASHDRRYAQNRKSAKEAQARLDERRRVKCRNCGKFTDIRKI